MTPDDLYREVILDHHRNPRATETLDRVDLEGAGRNPSCGDSVVVSLKLEGEIVNSIRVNTVGCAICTAAGSILGELAKGMSRKELESLNDHAKNVIASGATPDEEHYGDLAALGGVHRLPARVKCALLPFSAAQAALEGGG